MSKYDTFGARVGAAIVDSIIFAPLVFLDTFFSENIHSPKLLIFWTILSMSAFQIYSILMHGKYGQTLGKKSMSIKIVTYPDESPINYRHAFIRDLPYTILLIFDIILNISLLVSPELTFNSTVISFADILSYASFFWMAIEIVTMLFNDKKRAIHDIIAKTVVVKI